MKRQGQFDEGKSPSTTVLIVFSLKRNLVIIGILIIWLIMLDLLMGLWGYIVKNHCNKENLKLVNGVIYYHQIKIDFIACLYK